MLNKKKKHDEEQRKRIKWRGIKNGELEVE